MTIKAVTSLYSHDIFLVYFSGLSNRIMRKMFSHWRLEPVYPQVCTWHTNLVNNMCINMAGINMEFNPSHFQRPSEVHFFVKPGYFYSANVVSCLSFSLCHMWFGSLF